MRMRGMLLVIGCCLVTPTTGWGRAGGFYRMSWVEPDDQRNNTRRFRVNDEDLSLHETYGRRREAAANGLVLVMMETDLFRLDRAEIRFRNGVVFQTPVTDGLRFPDGCGVKSRRKR